MTTSKQREPTTTTLLIRGIEPSTRDDFKSACATAGLSMTEVLRTFMEESTVYGSVIERLKEQSEVHN